MPWSRDQRHDLSDALFSPHWISLPQPLHARSPVPSTGPAGFSASGDDRGAVSGLRCYEQPVIDQGLGALENGRIVVRIDPVSLVCSVRRSIAWFRRRPDGIGSRIVRGIQGSSISRFLGCSHHQLTPKVRSGIVPRNVRRIQVNRPPCTIHGWSRSVGAAGT